MADGIAPKTDIWAFQRRMMNRLLRINTVNLVVGLGGLTAKSPFWRGMGIQAVTWSAINIAIAVFAERGINKELATLDAPRSDEVQRRQTRHVRRIIAINAPLNLLYIASGLALKKRGKQDVFLRGNGWGIVLQGLLLLGFDTFHLRRLNAIWKEKQSS